jgi:hypothetical protein
MTLLCKFQLYNDDFEFSYPLKQPWNSTQKTLSRNFFSTMLFPDAVRRHVHTPGDPDVPGTLKNFSNKSPSEDRDFVSLSPRTQKILDWTTRPRESLLVSPRCPDASNEPFQSVLTDLEHSLPDRTIEGRHHAVCRLGRNDTWNMNSEPEGKWFRMRFFGENNAAQTQNKKTTHPSRINFQNFFPTYGRTDTVQYEILKTFRAKHSAISGSKENES